MTSRSYRAAVIGLGVGERHIFGYELHPQCRVEVLCDIDAAKLAEVAARHPGRRLTREPAEVLDDPSIDIVSIASYDNVHFEQIMRALDHGKHVFVEKPLCLTEAELAGIRGALAARPALQLSSNLILRRAPRFKSLHEQIRAGDLGRLYYVEGDYNYGRFHKLTSGWRGELPFYSVVHGGAIHMIDLLMWLAGERPTEVFAYGGRGAPEGSTFKFNDTVAAVLKFPSGMLGRITANFPCKMPHHHALTVHGTKASFVHNSLGARFFTSTDPEIAPSVVTTAYPGAQKGDMLPAFVDAVINGGEPEVTADEVMAGMQVSLAIERAATQGVPVPVVYN